MRCRSAAVYLSMNQESTSEGSAAPPGTAGKPGTRTPHIFPRNVRGAIGGGFGFSTSPNTNAAPLSIGNRGDITEGKRRPSRIEREIAAALGAEFVRSVSSSGTHL